MMPERLTPASVATPFVSVIAVPTSVPFRAKVIVLLLTLAPLAERVAVREAAPP